MVGTRALAQLRESQKTSTLQHLSLAAKDRFVHFAVVLHSWVNGFSAQFCVCAAADQRALGL